MKAISADPVSILSDGGLGQVSIGHIRPQATIDPPNLSEHDRMSLGPNMTFSSIIAPRAAPPRGPYSQAIRAGNLVFVSGQLPLDSEGSIVGPGDIKVQTRAVLANLAAILAASGSSLAEVVKTTVFLANLDDFRLMNEVYAEIFAPPYPARSTVEVARFPGGILVEIECIAVT